MSERGVHETDAVVVGGGLAGLVASMTFAENGANVVLLERADDLGGTSALSAGFFAFAATPEQRAAGVTDSDAQLHDDLVALSGVESELIDLYTEHQASSRSWLSALGARWVLNPAVGGSGQTAPRVHHTAPGLLLGALADRTGALGANLVTGAFVDGLVPDQGHWLVRARVDDGSTRTFRARRIVVCAGGFGSNPDLIRQQRPELGGVYLASAPGCDGTMLEELLALGAATRDLDVVEATFGKVVEDGAPLHPCLAVYLGAVAVNLRGRRFIDESRPYKEVGRACLAQPAGVAIQIMDRRILEVGIPGLGPFDLDAWLSQGFLHEHGSLTALAAFHGIEARALLAGIEAYNDDLARFGVDRRFGRTQLPGGEALTRIDSAPFYSCKSSSAVYGTYGGVAVDRSLRVATTVGAVLEGCYAAGECVGGFHGGGYMTGSSLGKAVIFGRLAARDALGLSTTVEDAWGTRGAHFSTTSPLARKESVTHAK